MWSSPPAHGENVTFVCHGSASFPSIFNNRDGASSLTYNCANNRLYKLDGKEYTTM